MWLSATGGTSGAKALALQLYGPELKSGPITKRLDRRIHGPKAHVHVQHSLCNNPLSRKRFPSLRHPRAKPRDLNLRFHTRPGVSTRVMTEEILLVSYPIPAPPSAQNWPNTSPNLRGPIPSLPSRSWVCNRRGEDQAGQVIRGLGAKDFSSRRRHTPDDRFCETRILADLAPSRSPWRPAAPGTERSNSTSAHQGRRRRREPGKTSLHEKSSPARALFFFDMTAILPADTLRVLSAAQNSCAPQSRRLPGRHPRYQGGLKLYFSFRTSDWPIATSCSAFSNMIVGEGQGSARQSTTSSSAAPGSAFWPGRQ